MRLHENPELFSDAIQAASEFKGIREVYIEKDYWVTLALHAIFHSEHRDVTVFRGGTALSKCHGLIKRFSEDVDIVVMQEEGESGNQLSNKIKAISKYVADILPEKHIVGITSKYGNFRKTAHEFDKVFDDDYGQVRQDIILEVSSLGNHEPHTYETVSSYITEMMLDQDQNKAIDKYDLAPFTVQVLSKSRTLCEKMMSLVRFSRSENPYKELANKIRHIYDIHALINDPDTKAFFESDEFDTMINSVGQDDVMTYRSGTDWLKHHPQTALIYSEPEKTWKQLRSTYNSTFKDLVIGESPDEALLVDALKTVSQRLSVVSWDLADE